MKPPPFRYTRADSVEGALQLLAEEGDGAKVLAGGQSLVPLLNLRLTRPDSLLDISWLDELHHHARSPAGLRIGALTTQREIELDDSVASACPLLAEAVPWVGHVAIRNRGTVCGSITHADPAAEAPVVLAALNGTVTLRSIQGERTVAAEEFFKGFLMTDARPDELVTEVTFPATDEQTGTAFEEFARRTGDFAIVSVACAIRRDDTGAVESARLAIGGVAGRPVVPPHLDHLKGARDDAPDRAAVVVDDAIDPTGDIHGSAQYRRHLARELVKRAVRRAMSGGDR
jgi:CO/xanthine dehydrogenase FAD-binding subunit